MRNWKCAVDFAFYLIFSHALFKDRSNVIRSAPDKAAEASKQASTHPRPWPYNECISMNFKTSFFDTTHLATILRAAEQEADRHQCRHQEQ